MIYELHVRGFTRHPSSGVRHPGTFLGLCEKIPHLKSLGVTAVQLMPVLEFDELDASRKNPLTGEPLRNYWGYSPLSFFAPKASYAAQAGRQVREFKEMVKAFHRAGIEVILDVVYNHTGEGNENGPTLSFRGLDNAIYYMLDREGRYYNFSGCGNTLNCNHPVVRDLILDSLAYLVAELHVDGFRFDLASVLGRGADGKVLEDPPLLQHIAEHPVLAGTKLLAEAVGRGGPVAAGQVPGLGPLGRVQRLVPRRRAPLRPRRRRGHGQRRQAHLRQPRPLRRHVAPPAPLRQFRDLPRRLHALGSGVSYNHKHNLANGENNRDGWDDNLSCNCGHEGPTHDAHVNAVRQRQVRNFLTLLLISQGVPFLTQGDEFGRTQQGNNNAYCQDNEISWVDWSLAEKNAGLLRFTRMMIALRQAALRPEPGAVRQSRELARDAAGRAGLDGTAADAGVPAARPAPSRILRRSSTPTRSGSGSRCRTGRAWRRLRGHQPAVAGRHRRGEGRRARCGRRTIISSRRAPRSFSSPSP